MLLIESKNQGYYVT